ncbi:hypothetical protein CPB86DRAFT_794293 [Serendipita vermifera]|nr:hypothetical protein CPB86DRAFT_794293 [Serendipita vermifera]
MPLVPRAPQGSASPTSTGSGTTIQTSSSLTSRLSTSSWDTRAGVPVYTSWGPSSTSSTSSRTRQSSNGFLSSKEGVAGLCAGIAVICLLVVGFVVCRIKNRKPTHPSRKRLSSTVSIGQASKRPPTPLQLGVRHRHPLQDPPSQSTSSSRSLQTPSQNLLYTPGQSATETSSLNYNKTISTSRSISPFNSFLPNTEQGSQSGPSSRPYSSAESRTSMLDTGSHISSSTMGLLQSTNGMDGNSVTKTIRRPLPFPPHPPPSYESLSRMDDNNSQPALAPSSKAAALGLPSHDPSSSSSPAYTTSEVPQSPYPYTSDAGTINNNQPLSPRESLQQTIVDPADYPTASGARKGQSEEGGRYSESSTVRPHSIDAPAHSAVGRISESSARPLQSPITEEGFQDPFNAAKYELPAWLNSDPFPSNHAGPSVRRSLSQSSLYPPKTPRSAAASSHVLPSEWSVRSLTPELPDIPPLPQETGHHNANVMATSDTNNTTTTTTTLTTPPQAHLLFASPHGSVHPSERPSSAATSALSHAYGPVEGDGPSPENVLVFPGAERPGWAQTPSPSPMVSSGSMSKNGTSPAAAGFESETTLAARGESSKDTTPTVIGEFVKDEQKQGDAEASARTSKLLTPSLLSDSVPGQGLSRSFTLDPSYRIMRPSRVMLRTSVGRSVNPNVINTSVLASPSTRPNSRVVSGVPASASSGNFVNLHPLDSPSSRGILTGSSFGNSNAASPGLMRNMSTSAGSRIVHSDLDSIRSVSPELGWIGEDAQAKETPLDQGKDERRKDQQQESSGGNKGSRTSRLSLGEAALLWAGLTSAMENEEQPRV